MVSVRRGLRQFSHGGYAAAARHVEHGHGAAEVLFRTPDQRAHGGIQCSPRREGDGYFYGTGGIGRVRGEPLRGECGKAQKDKKDKKRPPVKIAGKTEGRDEGKVTIRFHVTHYAGQV